MDRRAIRQTAVFTCEKRLHERIGGALKKAMNMNAGKNRIGNLGIVYVGDDASWIKPLSVNSWQPMQLLSHTVVEELEIYYDKQK